MEPTNPHSRTARRPLPRLPRGQAARLLREVERYLAAVETFRAEGREPRWRPEHTATVH